MEPLQPAEGPGLGLVATQRVVVATADDPLVLRHGARLGPVEIAYETYGELASDRSNVVVLCHALTGDAHAAGHHGDPSRRGWWDNLVGPGRAVDTDRFFVVSTNLLGGCNGTTGPSSVDPATGAAYGLEFPVLHMSDLVQGHRLVLRHLGVERVHAVVGGSMGGMQVLQWAVDHPGEIDRAVLVAASSRLTAQNIALSAVARHAISSDPDFRDGQYAAHGVRPDRGLSTARRLAHVTYVSEELLEEKFGREIVDDEPAPPRLGTQFQVEAYLDHQARIFLERFDALSYLYLSRVMDHYDPFAEPGATAAVSEGGTAFDLVSFTSDWRFPSAHSERVHDHLVRAGASSRHTVVASTRGHDSFLLTPPGYHDLVRAALGRRRGVG